jgi:hypothetical protein
MCGSRYPDGRIVDCILDRDEEWKLRELGESEEGNEREGMEVSYACQGVVRVVR